MKTQQDGIERHTVMPNKLSMCESEPDSPTRPPEQHSPLPWSTTEQGLFIRGGGQRICTMATREPCTRDEHATREANAAYIVKAANELPKIENINRMLKEEYRSMKAQRDELLAALKDLRNAADNCLPCNGDGFLNDSIQRAEAAIAKCEAQP